MAEGPFRPRGERPRETAPEPPAEPSGKPERLRRPPPQKPPASVASQATWIAGLVLFIVVVYITINTLRTEGPGSRGIEPGDPMPVFAAPLAIGGPDRDANLAVRAREDTPRACDVRGDGVFNLCELTERGPVVLAFLAAGSERCAREVDVLDRLRARYRGVGFAAVGIRGKQDELAKLVRERGWRMPVAWDRDGAVANAYSVAVCPTVTFAEKGGTVHATTLGEAREAVLARNVEAIR